MTKCVVCEAFQAHIGPHFSLKELTTVFYNHRRHSATGTGSMVLPGVLTAAGERVVMCLQAPDHPEARFVDGLWLVEASGPLLERRPLPRAAEADASSSAPGLPLSCSLSSSVPLGADAIAGRREWTLPARGQAGPAAPPSVGVRVAWVHNGQTVDIRAVLGAATRHAARGLRAALRELESQDAVHVECSVDQRAGEVHVRMKAGPGQEGKLLMASGRLVDDLGKSHHWDRLELVSL